jgi:PIN domain nuclease of toxin-antitoxin system
MIALLDTHILLWWLADHRSLSKTSRDLIREKADAVFVSAVSAWEIAIKKAAGKLRAPDDLEAALAENEFEVLPISLRHALAAGALPKHHDDPFDRMLVAQAFLEDMKLFTGDKRLAVYWDRVHIAR